MAARWRVVLFDKRRSGLSDRQNTPDLEMRADDLRAVLDAVGSEAAILVGAGEGRTCGLFCGHASRPSYRRKKAAGSARLLARQPQHPRGRGLTAACAVRAAQPPRAATVPS